MKIFITLNLLNNLENYFIRDLEIIYSNSFLFITYKKNQKKNYFKILFFYIIYILIG
jgi:hypothetical protein